MASETTYICDWCKTRVENPDVYPFNMVNPTIVLSKKARSEIYLFPEDMRGREEGTKHIPSDFEGDLCDDCVQEIVHAVLRAREVRISKRPKK